MSFCKIDRSSYNFFNLCDPVLKDQICNHKGYEKIDNKQDT